MVFTLRLIIFDPIWPFLLQNDKKGVKNCFPCIDFTLGIRAKNRFGAYFSGADLQTCPSDPSQTPLKTGPRFGSLFDSILDQILTPKITDFYCLGPAPTLSILTLADCSQVSTFHHFAAIRSVSGGHDLHSRFLTRDRFCTCLSHLRTPDFTLIFILRFLISF